MLDLADDVLRLLDALALERVSFCGLSLGGAVGMALAAAQPERIDRLVLACTSARFGPREAWIERAELVRAGGVEAVADAVLGRWFTPAFRETSPGTIAQFRTMLLETPPRATRAAARRSRSGTSGLSSGGSRRRRS